ncbi:MAG: hypothetical protein ABSB55_08220 [Acidimicrobiales bacterium]
MGKGALMDVSGLRLWLLTGSVKGVHGAEPLAERVESRAALLSRLFVQRHG